MRIASTSLVAAWLLSILSPGVATAQLTDDLWDVSQGVVITGHSSVDHDAGQGIDIRDAFGAAYTKLLAARGMAIFDDNQPPDFVDWIEWRTPSRVAVRKVMVHLDVDVPSGERAVGSLRVFSRLGPGSPWVKIAGTERAPSHGQFAARVEPALAQEFRAEFVRKPIPGSRFHGPRVVELDATGDACPYVLTQPQSSATCIGGEVRFSVTAGGSGPLTYTWFCNGVPIADGRLESGAGVAGAAAPTLTVSAARAGDDAAYWCVVASPVGRVSSEPAMLRVCAADCNCDGHLTAEDAACFESRFASQDVRADLNHDGLWDMTDRTLFREAFATCTPGPVPGQPR